MRPCDGGELRLLLLTSVNWSSSAHSGSTAQKKKVAQFWSLHTYFPFFFSKKIPDFIACEQSRSLKEKRIRQIDIQSATFTCSDPSLLRRSCECGFC